jgi:hypothetical protein
MRFAAVVASVAFVAAPARAAVPKPEEVLGFRPGADYKLADYPAIVKYFKALDAASDRVSVQEIGPTAEGRTMIVAFITSEANQKKLDRYREISRRLALARDLDDAQARALAAEGRAIVWIDSGLHSTEVAHAQHAPELAYRVATEESEEMRRIRDETILVQVPVMNPDGLDKVVAWYTKNLGTPYEVSPMVELYQKYVGHDNNRDWYMFNMPESRNVAKLLYEQWFPQIVYNHHQSAPFPARIFVPPFADPMNPNIPPQIMRGIQVVGDAITSRLEREGKVGAISRVGFDTWWNGGMRTAPYFHNMVGILTETALWRYATPHQYDPTKLPRRFREGTPTDVPTTFYPSPWKGGWWRLRDAVDYMLTASVATLDIGAKKRFDWLYAMYLMGKEATSAGAKGEPYAYVIPPGQWDPGAAARLVEVLKIGGLEIQRAAAEFTAGGRTFASGSIVVPMAQPFRAYAKDLLEPQRYPDLRQYPNGPPLRPYDITGWTLPAQMGVEGVMVAKPFTASLQPLGASTVEAGSVTGSGSTFVVSPRANAAFLLANRVLKAGGEVSRVKAAFQAAGASFEPGSFVLKGGLDRAAVETIARERGLRVAAVDAAPSVDLARLRTLRLGLYKPWVPTIDEGWTRWVLEQFEFPYRTMTDTDVRRGGLKDAFDVIVIPDVERAGSSTKTLLEGNPPGSVPPEYTGGIGLEGALALKDFVRAGGTLVTLDSASDFAIDLFGLGLRNALRGVPTQEYYAPGGLVKVTADPSQPLAWGLPANLAVFVENGPAFEEDREAGPEGDASPEGAPNARPAARIAARFAEKDVLYSGWLLGEPRIAKKAALVEVPLEKGRVVLVGFRPQFRGQSHATFKVLFNALLRGAGD